MSEKIGKISYKLLWELMTDRVMTKTELRCKFDVIVENIDE